MVDESDYKEIPKKSSKKKFIISFILIFAVLIGGYFFFMNKTNLSFLSFSPSVQKGIVQNAGAGNSINVSNVSANAITITNSTNDTIAVAVLDTPHINYVARGKNRLVAEFNITNFNAYMSPIGNISLIDKRTNQTINRIFTYKYLILNGTDKTPIFYNSCFPVLNLSTSKNDTICNIIQNGTITTDHYDWSSFTAQAILGKGNITLGVFADVLSNDYVEWIPTLYGINITQWAIWSDSYNTGLFGVWKFDENTGTNLKESKSGILNGTLNSLNWTGGIQGSAIGDKAQFLSSNSMDSIFANTSNPITISFWVNLSSNDGDDHSLIGRGRDSVNHGFFAIWYNYNVSGGNVQVWRKKDADSISSFVDFKGVINSTDQGLKSKYINLVVTITGTNDNQVNLYKNGINQSVPNYIQNGLLLDLNLTGENMSIGFGKTTGGSDMQNISVDELYIWNRSLSPSEINNLYDNGAGTFYSKDTLYPQFSNYVDNNGTKQVGGIGLFNVTVLNTNGTVILTFNNTNFTASNNSGNPNIFNVTINNVLAGTVSYNWSSYGNGTLSLYNISNTKIYTVFNPPSIQILYPSNNSNFSINTVNVNYTASSIIGLTNCWYAYDDYSTNYSLTDCTTNITDVVWNEGEHNVTIYGNDTLGNVNSSEVSFIVDTAIPLINIDYPQPINYSKIITAINYTATNPFLLGCWYSTDNGVTNSSIDYSCSNFTGLSSIEGINNWTVYAEDIALVINSTTVKFIQDTKPPFFTNSTPKNQTLVYGVPLSYYVNASDSGVGVSCFSVNDSNFQINCSGYLKNITAMGGGIRYLNISVNDTVGNLNSTKIYINITKANITIGLLLNQLAQNISINYPTQVNASATATGGILTLYRNGTNDTVDNGQNVSLGLGYYVYKANATGNANYSSNATGLTFSINISDNTYPQFSNYWDNGLTLVTTARLNVTVLNTNGTVILTFNNTNFTASNNSGDPTIFNVTIGIATGNYTYNWSSYGNNIAMNYNMSNSFVFYSVPDTTPPTITNLINKTIIQRQAISYTITAMDSSGLGTWTINDTTNFKIGSSTGTLQNNTLLSAVQIYWLNVTINDTFGNLASGIFYVNVTSSGGGGGGGVATKHFGYEPILQYINGKGFSYR